MKKISFLGDSITVSWRATTIEKGYVYLVGKYLNVESIGYGIGSTRIAKRRVPSDDITWDQYYGSRVDSIDIGSDLVGVFGGTNDYGHGDAELGDINSFDEYTFCGALNVLINKLINRFGKEKIFFILPLHRFNESNPYGDCDLCRYPLKDYVDAMISVLKKYEIPYLDLFSNCPYELPVPEGYSEYYFDGLHPNDKGYELLAKKIVEFIEKNF